MTSNRPFSEDSTEMALFWGWETMKEYLSSMEEYLEKATEQFEARVNEQKKKLTSEQLVAEHGQEYVYYYDEFPYILRNSFLVSAYSLFEFDIDIICRKLKDNHKIPISCNQLKGDVLERIKNYYKLAGLDLTYDNPMWEEITQYAKIRNCIVHNNGFLKEDYTDLIRYIRRKN